MSTLADFPVVRRWPPRDPQAIQLYSFPTPNGIKVAAMLEETGLAYEAHLVDILEGDQTTPEFLRLSPNNKIPAIIDPVGPDGCPIGMFESGAILIYLAEKTGQLMPAARRLEILQWLMFQMGGVGPMFGQLGWFVKSAGTEIEDPRPRERFRAEAQRLLGVIDAQLARRGDWIVGEYSIADLALGPWLRSLRDYQKMGDAVGWDDLAHVPGYLDRFLDRPAVQRALNIPPRP